MTSLSITVTDHHSCSVVTLAGELDRLSAGRLQRVLDQVIGEGRARLVVDVAELTFCDSTGMWVLMKGHCQASAAGGWLRLAYVHGVLKRILQVSKTAGLFPDPVDLTVIMER
ncbi:STAS domain-containing protein [Streptosporangium sp. NPDC048865]|uniref:STAS domain-containing protein n=1 Tax=Streptosporangium sp. NPDC048865 TaxID=3155766 RepID=UPI0034351B53